MNSQSVFVYKISSLINSTVNILYIFFNSQSKYNLCYLNFEQQQQSYNNQYQALATILYSYQYRTQQRKTLQQAQLVSMGTSMSYSQRQLERLHFRNNAIPRNKMSKNLEKYGRYRSEFKHKNRQNRAVSEQASVYSRQKQQQAQKVHRNPKFEQEYKSKNVNIPKNEYNKRFYSRQKQNEFIQFPNDIPSIQRHSQIMNPGRISQQDSWKQRTSSLNYKQEDRKLNIIKKDGQQIKEQIMNKISQKLLDIVNMQAKQSQQLDSQRSKEINKQQLMINHYVVLQQSQKNQKTMNTKFISTQSYNKRTGTLNNESEEVACNIQNISNEYYNLEGNMGKRFSDNSKVFSKSNYQNNNHIFGKQTCNLSNYHYNQKQNKIQFQKYCGEVLDQYNSKSNSSNTLQKNNINYEKANGYIHNRSSNSKTQYNLFPNAFTYTNGNLQADGKSSNAFLRLNSKVQSNDAKSHYINSNNKSCKKSNFRTSSKKNGQKTESNHMLSQIILYRNLPIKTISYTKFHKQELSHKSQPKQKLSQTQRHMEKQVQKIQKLVQNTKRYSYQDYRAVFCNQGQPKFSRMSNQNIQKNKRNQKNHPTIYQQIDEFQNTPLSFQYNTGTRTIPSVFKGIQSVQSKQSFARNRIISANPYLNMSQNNNSQLKSIEIHKKQKQSRAVVPEYKNSQLKNDDNQAYNNAIGDQKQIYAKQLLQKIKLKQKQVDKVRQSQLQVQKINKANREKQLIKRNKKIELNLNVLNSNNFKLGIHEVDSKIDSYYYDQICMSRKIRTTSQYTVYNFANHIGTYKRPRNLLYF